MPSKFHAVNEYLERKLYFSIVLVLVSVKFVCV